MVNKRLYLIPVKDACNASCTFCYMKEKLVDPDKAQLIDFERLKTMILPVIDEFQEVELTGGGEPLLHPKINDIIQFFKDNNKYVKLYSNGFKLKNIPVIDEINISRVHWNSKINNQFYQSKFQNDLDKTLNHYQTFAKKIRMQTILLKGAIDTKEKLEEFISKHEDRVDTFMVRTLFTKCALDKEKFVDYFPLKHPKLVYDKTLDNYDRDLFFMGSDCTLHDDFQYE